MVARINFTDEQKEEIIRLYTEENLGMEKIGKIFNCSKGPIKRILKEHNIQINIPKKDIYKEGDILGPYNILLIEKINNYTSKNNIKQKNGYGKFLCPNHPKNDPHYFIAQLIAVNTGHTTQCKECAVKAKKEKLLPYQQAQRVDLTGQKFGMLTALNIIEGKHASDGSCLWLCKCDCGNYHEAGVNALKTKRVQSCGCLRSIGEKLIKNILINNNINFEQEYSFNNCINPQTKRKLRFDFYLPNYNCCIEYQGKQHYEYNKNWVQTKEEFKEGIKRDKIKKEYCQQNNIKLIEIPYTDYNKINYEYLKEKIA